MNLLRRRCRETADFAAFARRYAVCPELQVYDERDEVIAPYLTFTSPPNKRSAVVNTDANGFRLSTGAAGSVDSSARPGGYDGVVVGGSFVFGVGATGDQHTLVSELNRLTGLNHLNLGIRAANSLQEAVAAMPFLADCRQIFVISGVNNLTVNLQSSGRNDLYGPFFMEEQFECVRQRPMWDIASRLRPQAATSRLLSFGGGTGLAEPANARPSAGGDTDPAQAVARAIAFQQCHLRVITAIARAGRRPCRVVFAVQPFAEVCGKPLTAEEQELFRLTDHLQSARWRGVLQTVVGALPRLAAEMRHCCAELEVEFVDMNAFPFSGWCFVDRVHMSDEGYRQAAHHLFN